MSLLAGLGRGTDLPRVWVAVGRAPACPRELLIPTFYPSHGAAAPSSSGNCRDREAQLEEMNRRKVQFVDCNNTVSKPTAGTAELEPRTNPPRPEKQLATSYKINTTRSSQNSIQSAEEGLGCCMACKYWPSFFFISIFNTVSLSLQPTAN